MIYELLGTPIVNAPKITGSPRLEGIHLQSAHVYSGKSETTNVRDNEVTSVRSSVQQRQVHLRSH